VIPPVGESLPNTEIFRRLAARFGFDDACFRAGDRELMDDAVDGAHPYMQGVKPSQISTASSLRMSLPGGRPLALFDNLMPGTPSGKIELASDPLAQRWGAQARLPGFRPRVSDFPLALVSPASDKRITSTWLGPDDRNGEPSPLLMHPEDARARGLDGAGSVRVWNELGSAVLPLRITEAVTRGVVASEKGAWLATSATGSTINALVSADDRADLAKGACYNDTRVEVERA
jgi:anaerobic selenocysteine-containing dehydrogenase